MNNAHVIEIVGVAREGAKGPTTEVCVLATFPLTLNGRPMMCNFCPIIGCFRRYFKSAVESI